MRTPTRIAAFAATLGAVFGAAALAGAGLDPVRDPARGGGADMAAGHSGGHGSAVIDPTAADRLGAAGLAVADGGYRLVAEATSLPRGEATRVAFRILDPRGVAVTGFDVEHERKMHLIVVRRDLTGYQHLHPTLDAHGRWRVTLRLPEAGVYRAYADFGTGGRSMTLATDLFVAGPFRPSALPDVTAVDTTAGYRAELSAPNATAGADAEISYDLSRGGRPLTDIEPYLGADGHLVALREGDLAFLHVHPEESATPGRIRFGASLPSAGRYRLFLQFRHDGRVRTVAHTLEVSG